MGRPVVLDLFCNAGGAATGYSRAGFRVLGVDKNPQPNYPFEFMQADVFEFVCESVDLIGSGFDLVHASPPCQYSAAITKGTNAHRQHLHPDLYLPTVVLLDHIGLPYVIENPAARPDMVLCGEMFGLDVIRHRNLELGGWKALAPKHIKHRGRVRGWRHGVYHDGPYVAAYGKGGGKATVPEMQMAMGIDWTDVHGELVEMLPPAYTQYIGERFLAAHPPKGTI